MSIISSLFGTKSPKNDAIKILDAKTFKESISNKKVQLIDVRTPNEFKSRSIKGAKNIDFYSGDFSSEFNKLDTQKPIYIYCQSGTRSKYASKKLTAMGFTVIYDLKGGISNY